MLTCSDINQLSAESAAGTQNMSFDVNSDGVVDVADVNHWIVTLKGTLLGDANLDFVVDASDFNLWNGSKFTSTTAWCSGNFNGDTVVDASDFNVWNSNKFRAALVATRDIDEFAEMSTRSAGTSDQSQSPVGSSTLHVAPTPAVVEAPFSVQSPAGVDSARRRHAVKDDSGQARIDSIFAELNKWWA